MRTKILTLGCATLVACSGYGDTRRAVYESSLSEYKAAWARHRAQAERHGELTRTFDEAKARGASTEELTRCLGAMWEILRSDGLTLVEVSEREKSLAESCRRLGLRECASDKSFRAFLDRYRDEP